MTDNRSAVRALRIRSAVLRLVGQHSAAEQAAASAIALTVAALVGA